MPVGMCYECCMVDDYAKRLYDSLAAITPVPEGELAFLRGILKPARLSANEHFIKAGETPRKIGFVVQGLLRIYYSGASAAEFTTRFFTENSFAASYIDFLEQRPSAYYIQAIEESSLLELDFPAYTTLLSRDPCWQILGKKMMEEMFSRKLARETDLLSCGAEERYRRFRADYPDLEKRLKQYHIASYLGISPVSLSRIRKNKLS
jgi:CRP-like cAMP-binding protein